MNNNERIEAALRRLNDYWGTGEVLLPDQVFSDTTLIFVLSPTPEAIELYDAFQEGIDRALAQFKSKK